MLTSQYMETILLLHRSASLRGIEHACRSLLGQLEIPYFRYEWQPTSDILGAKTQQFSTCPSRWVEHCKERNYESVNPKRAYARNNVLPVMWQPDQYPKYTSEIERQFWRDSNDFGLGHGAVIPIRSRFGGSGMLCITLPADPVDRAFAAEHLPHIEALAHHLQERVQRLVANQLFPLHALTKRETEVVQWTACGKTADEISQILGISVTTVLYHLNNAKHKLDVINKHQLTARALALGLV